MGLSHADLSTLAGATGIGAMVLLGLFLFADGLSPEFFPTFERYASTMTWEILAALPVLALSYVLGVWAIAIGEAMASLAFGRYELSFASELARLSTLESEVTLAVYCELVRKRQVLAGSAVGLLMLAAGAASETANLQHMARTVLSLSALSLVGSGSFLFLAATQAKLAHEVATEALAAHNAGTGDA